MQSKTLSIVAKSAIWICLAAILFSPLYVSSRLFFPFIVTKTVAFSIAAEIMALAFLFLAWKNNDYKIKINLVVVLMAVYLVLSFFSSLLGNDFYRSFWSNNERSEGLLLLLHLFLFLVVLSGFFRKLKDWLLVFDIFFLSSFLVALIALGQHFELNWLFASSGGQRLAGTIGNAGYMAGYLVFAVFFGLFLLFKRKNVYLKFYYSGIIALEIFIILFTDTRGGILALLLGLLLFALYLFFFYFNRKHLKKVGAAIIILAIALSVIVLLNKDSAWVKSNRVLARMASISSNSVTAQNRVMTWQSAFSGFKEKPIFGWGQENFYQPFDKYFNPKIYRHGGSVIWYDRAHNIIFDRLITGGFLGLMSYLALLFAPFCFLWRYFMKKEPETDSSAKGRKYFIPMIFSLVIIAYFIQNLFIFEALVTYIPLFLVLSFVGLFGRHYEWRFLADQRIKFAIFIFWLIVFLPISYFVNIKPLKANLDLTQALSNRELSVNERMDLFKSVLSRNTRGNQEYRRQLHSFLESLLAQKFSDQQIVSDLTGFAEDEMGKQLVENPNSASNYLLVMRFNNFMFSQTGRLDYLKRNLELFEKVRELSPSRQVVYFEIGYSNASLGNYFKQTGQKEMAEKYYNLAVDNFKYALELNNENFESSRQLASSLIYVGRNQAVMELIDQMDRVGVKYGKIGFLTEIANTGVSVKNYQIVKLIAEKLIELDANNPQYYVQLALAQAYLGEDDQAIKIAGKIGEFGEDYRIQSEDFIKKVQRGEFK